MQSIYKDGEMKENIFMYRFIRFNGIFTVFESLFFKNALNTL